MDIQLSELKVLHCIPSMGGGGAERQLCYLAAKMSQKGIEFHVAYLQEGPNSERLNASGALIHKLVGISNYDPMILYKLISIIRRVQPHIVQTWVNQMDIMAGIASLLSKVPFIISERTSAPAYGIKWKRWLQTYIGKQAAGIVANSEKGLDYWIKRTNSPALKIIRNGIPFEEINDARTSSLDSLEINSVKEVILFAGRYDKEKNLFNLLAALNIVLGYKIQAIAVLFGEGPQKNDLVKMKNRLATGQRIHLKNFTHDIWGWFKRVDVFVSVSIFEGNPNTVLEAAACRCPTVLSDIPEHKEIFDDNSSYFVPATNPELIAKGIMEVLSKPDRAKVTAKNALQKVRRWSVESTADEYLNFYNQIFSL